VGGGLIVKIPVAKIKIMERIRKEITKIDALALDISQNGLLHAVTVMPLDGGEFRLLAGLRRIKAAQSLGWTEIEAKVVSPVDAESALRIEISENEQREPFTFTERVDFGRLLEEIETAKARERMSEGGKGGVKEGVFHGTYLGQGRSRDIIGAKIVLSGSQYGRARYIAENALPEVIEQLDKGERTIRGTYDELRAREKAEKPAVPHGSMEIEDESKQKTPIEDPAPLTKRAHAGTKTPSQKQLSARDMEAIRKLREYDALPSEGKITELQRQLREARARAAGAESELARLKELRHNDVYHRDSIIESLKRQLAAANARVQELEAQYESA
jgi:ParB family chromosome partitioning protein